MYYDNFKKIGEISFVLDKDKQYDIMYSNSYGIVYQGPIFYTENGSLYMFVSTIINYCETYLFELTSTRFNYPILKLNDKEVFLPIHKEDFNSDKSIMREKYIKLLVSEFKNIIKFMK